MKITSIEKQKNNKDRSSVYIDEKFAFGIDDFDLYKLKLKIGTTITENELLHIKETVLFTSAKEYAISLVSRYMYTCKKMIDKLNSRGYDNEIIEKTIVFLKSYNYINDLEYAQKYINDSLRIKHIGFSKIRYDLIIKGVPNEIIEEAISQFDVYFLENESILPIAEKKLAGNFEYKNIMKTKRYLLSKGFSYELIDSTINALINRKGEC